MTSLSDYSVDRLAEFFDYLDELRESGATNMFGARPYLVREYRLKPDAVSKILSAWMHTFDRLSTPEERAERALKSEQIP